MMQTSVSTPAPSSISAPTPNPCQPDLLDQVRTIMREFMDIRSVQAAFNAYMVHDNCYADEAFNALQTKLLKVFNENENGESTELAVKHIISITGMPTNNDETVEILMKILEKLVCSPNVPARLVCEALLDSERLTIKNSKFWINSFILIKKIIPGVDYKGVREIMKTCLEKVGLFPEKIPPSQLPQLNAVVRLLNFIFDRNACLLPAYFIVNEILKNHPEKRQFPHWKVSQLLTDFVDSFQPIAQMVTVIGRSRMLPVVEHSHSGYSLLSWKLDPVTLRFLIKGNLPYDKDSLHPQDRMLRLILEQPYSRDLVCAILGLQKQHKIRCITLEDRLVELILVAMERTEVEMSRTSEGQSGYDDISASVLWLWQHLSTQIIFFVLFQLASFPHLVMAIHQKLAEAKISKGRDFLMWVLLQFISGSIQKNSLGDFLPVLQLYDLLYPEKDPLPVPDITKSSCVAQMAATCIWIHILKKAQTENQFLSRPLPGALKKHYDYLQSFAVPNNSQAALNVSDFRVALLANAFSTNTELFSRPMGALVEAMHGNSANTVPVAPLSVQILDSLTVHTKMSLIHNIVTHISKISITKSNQNLNPALVETYARLLVYLEIESLGIKGFMSQLLPSVFKSQAWGILHTLLEMFCYRLHHIQPHYRMQLLSQLNALATNAHSTSAQLHVCVETTALRLITSFNSVDVHTQFSRIGAECKSLVSQESEELNRALVLTIAKAIHVTGSDTMTGSGTGGASWFRDILTHIMQNTPHSWSTHVLQCFPPVLADFFQQNQVPKENKQQLKNMVDEEYRNWNAMINNEKELIEHFSLQGTPPLFLCIVWKMILDTDRVNPVALRVIERIGPKGISANLRKFCDYVMCEFTNAGGGQFVNKLADAISDMIWKYNVIPFDRLLLCLALRNHEGNEAQVCFFIIHMLLIKPVDFKNRIQEFVRDNSPEHWKQTSWHEKHKSFTAKFPEVSHFEGQQQNPVPMYFGNVCLRFLPVFDIMIHRFLEMNNIHKSLEVMLEQMSPLYKFHDRPITYLYNTLNYYEARLRDKPLLKKKIVSAILGALRDVKPPNWALSDQYQLYIQGANGAEDINWTPDVEYYSHLINKFVDVLEGRRKYFAPMDWRFNEFPNPAAHVVHATCVEIMALPVVPEVAANGILQVIMLGRAETEANDANMDVESWFNATGLLLVTLPDSYWLVLHEKIVSTVEKLSSWKHKYSPLQLFNFKTVKNGYLHNEYANLLAITHAFWYHLGIGHWHHVQTLVTEKLPPIVQNEVQLLFVGHLVAPYLQRLNSERPNMVCRLTIAFYELLEKVDKSVPKEKELAYMDIFCDLLYHIKYMYTGDIVKSDVEPIILRLRPALQLRLRFITHLNLNVEEITGGSAPTQTGQNPQNNQNVQNIVNPQGMKYHD